MIPAVKITYTHTKFKTQSKDLDQSLILTFYFGSYMPKSQSSHKVHIKKGAFMSKKILNC